MLRILDNQVYEAVKIFPPSLYNLAPASSTHRQSVNVA